MQVCILKLDKREELAGALSRLRWGKGKAATYPWTKTQRWSADDGLVWSSMPCGNSDEAVGSKLEKEKGSIEGRPWAVSGDVLCSLFQPGVTYR